MNNTFVINNGILDFHIRNVLSSNFDDVFESSDYYNFKCNVCGDSSVDKFKKRGYILKNKDPWVYYCHNCGTSTTALKWMKEYFPVNYKNFMIDNMRQKKDVSSNVIFKSYRKHKDRDESVDVKYFKKMIKFSDCVEYCENRKIPKDVYNKWYYAIGGVFKGRIIIPFLNDSNRIYYYQGRKFNNEYGVKYLSRFGNHDVTIYNYYNVDTTKHVIILEGPIDAIFVENSIALTGLKVSDTLVNDIPKKVFLLDNDISGNKKSLKLLSKGSNVFVWDKFLKYYKCSLEIKDVNDFILQNKSGILKLTYDIIKPFITNNSCDKIFFKIK
jgi:hypothetical protein